MFFWPFGIFSLPASGLFLCSRLCGTQGPVGTPRASWALAEILGTCSGGSKCQVPSGRDSKHVEPYRPMQTHVQVQKCPAAHVTPRILYVVNVARHYLVMERYFHDTNLRDMRPFFLTIKYNLHDLGRTVSSQERPCVEDMTTRWLGLHLRPTAVRVQ